LVTKGTRDEGYYWSSQSREKKMEKNMHELQKRMPARINNEYTSETCNEKEQVTLLEYDGEKIQVVIDQREVRSTVARELEKAGMDITLNTLEVGDYVLSDRIAVERKSSEDFVGSLIEHKLFEQISNLANAYEKPVLILEGESLFNSRGINPNAIHGALSAISLDFGVAVFYTRDAEDTAVLIKQIAKREQIDEKRNISMHGRKSSKMLPQQQEYVVSAISDIGPTAARNLLMHFGSVENVMKADNDELLKVKNIGSKTAAKIREIVSSEYKL